MQALRDFWAKNTTNKLIVLAIVGLLCCCPLGLAGRGNQASQVAPTTAPAAAAPTEAPAAVPTDAPTEAPTAVVEIGGLGVTRDELRQVFSKFGFRFEENALQDGTPRLLGQGPQSVMVELTGPPEGLTSVGLMAPLPTGDSEAASTVGTYMGTLVGAVAPEHVKTITDWVVEQLKATQRGEDVTGATIDTGAYQSELTTIPANDGMLITYSLHMR